MLLLSFYWRSNKLQTTTLLFCRRKQLYSCTNHILLFLIYHLPTGRYSLYLCPQPTHKGLASLSQGCRDRVRTLSRYHSIATRDWHTLSCVTRVACLRTLFSARSFLHTSCQWLSITTVESSYPEFVHCLKKGWYGFIWSLRAFRHVVSKNAKNGMVMKFGNCSTLCVIPIGFRN